MSMFGSISQAAIENKIVLEISSSTGEFRWNDVGTLTWKYEWEEIGNPSNISSSSPSERPYLHTIQFGSPGEYKLYITPLSGKPQPSYYIGDSAPTITRISPIQIKSIDSWGSNIWHQTLTAGFKGCSNLDILATDCPVFDHNYNINLTEMFYGNYNLKNENRSLSNWVTTKVTNLTNTFQSNYPLSASVFEEWEISNVTSLSLTFYNTPISGNFATREITKNGRTYLAWDTSNVTDFQSLFRGTSTRPKPNPSNISNWNTSKGTNMKAMFSLNDSFNQDISTKQVTIAAGTPLEKTYNAWDVSKVTSFGNNAPAQTNRYTEGMFYQAKAFDQDISNWQINTSSATANVTMRGMFCEANSFNAHITGGMVTVGTSSYEAWNTSKVYSFQNMFYNFSTSTTMSFNQPIGDWDTSGAIYFQGMFLYHQHFNQDLSKWNTSNGTNMDSMFRGTNMQYALSSSYQNHPTRGEYIAWDTSNVTSMGFMFQQVGSSVGNGYNSDINNWNTSNVTDLRGTFGAAYLKTSSFNQDISTKQVTIGAGTSLETTYNAWDVSKVRYFGFISNATNYLSYTGHYTQGTFYNNKHFNQPIGNWQINTGSDVYMQDIFANTRDFNQPLSQSVVTIGTSSYEAWNVKSVKRFGRMFYNSNYDNFQSIENWQIGSLSLNTLAGLAPFYQMFYDTTGTLGNLSSSYQPTSGKQPYIAWDMQNVEDLAYMFTYVSDNEWNGDISNWDTSNVTRLEGTFAGYGGVTATNLIYYNKFNGDISTKQVTIASGTALERTYNAWDVKNVTLFAKTNITTNSNFWDGGTFYKNQSFNQDIGNWQINTGSTVSVLGMFFEARAFNQDINTKVVTVGSENYVAWDVQKFNTFLRLFSGQSTGNMSFNSPIGNWNVTNRANMSSMFQNNNNFNQEISASIQTFKGQTYNAWYLENVTSIDNMFYNATSFSKDIRNWYVNDVTTFSETFYNADGLAHSLATQSVSLDGVSYTSWDIGTASFNNMFYFSAFDGTGVDTWNVSNVTSFGSHFMNGSGLTNGNYDNILVSWDKYLSGSSYPNGINFGTAQYNGTIGSAPSASHYNIEEVYSISLLDGGPV